MKNLVLHDVSQDSAYRYTGITTFENLAEVTVVLAMGAKPVIFDTTFLEEAKIPFAKIGDCGERAADIANAVRTAYDTLNAIS